MPKEGKKKPPAVIIDGIDTTLFSREKLEQFTIKVKEELDREREERNYFQTERDKIRIIYENTLEELEEAKAILKIIERASEVTQEETYENVAVGRQKIKFMKYEQVGYIKALEAENEVALEAAKEEHDLQEIELLDDKRHIKLFITETLEAEVDELKRAKEKHAEELLKTKAKYDIQETEIEDRVLKKLKETIIELEVRHRTDLAEVMQRKNKHLFQLTEQHEKSYGELRNHYNDITLNNLGLIGSIKRKIEESEEAAKRADQIYLEAAAKAKKLRKPLELAILDNKELKRHMSNYDRDKATLKTKNIILVKLKNQNELLKWRYENLEVEFDKIRQERDGMKDRFPKAILEVKAKLSENVPELEAMLGNTRDVIPLEIQKILKIKDMQIDDLRYETACFRKAHDDLLATYEAKLLKLGVPSKELGFQQLNAVAVAGISPIVGLGPAGLVTRNF